MFNKDFRKKFMKGNVFEFLGFFHEINYYSYISNVAVHVKQVF